MLVYVRVVLCGVCLLCHGCCSSLFVRCVLFVVCLLCLVAVCCLMCDVCWCPLLVARCLLLCVGSVVC